MDDIKEEYSEQEANKLFKKCIFCHTPMIGIVKFNKDVNEHENTVAKTICEPCEKRKRRKT